MSSSETMRNDVMFSAAGRGNLVGPALFFLIVAASLPVFWYGFVSLGEAWVTPEYSHGPIIPILSGYLFLRDMRRVPPTAVTNAQRIPGLAIIIFSLAIGIFGNLVNIPDISTYAFILWVGGLILLCFGYSRGVLFWASVLHLVYMLPLPNFLYWQLTIQLQLISSVIGVWIVSAMNIPVFLEGNVIDLGIYKLQVAEACSGLRYLFPILSFSYVFCMLYNGPRWHKIIILLSAAPITVLMNSFRIGMIGVLVNSYGIEHAEGFLHFFEGWVIFGACVGLLFLLAIVMQRFQRKPKPLAETLDIDFDGLGAQVARVMTIPAATAVWIAAAVMVIVAGVWTVTPETELKRVEREPFGFFSMQQGDWEGFTTPLEPAIEAVLGADDYVQATFSKPGIDAPVSFFSAFYHRQTEGSGIHSPEVCLPVGGWEMFDINPVTIDLEAESGWAPFQTNRAVIQNGLQQQVIYYWFEQRGRRLTNDFNVKMVTIWDSLTKGRQDGALVRFGSPVLQGETVEDADRRIQALMVDVLPKLPRYLPE